jgi:hypothetical protein
MPDTDKCREKEAEFEKKELLRVFDENHIFYHYTTLGALHGIINEKVLWLTSMNCTNDPDELDHSYRFASNYLKLSEAKDPIVAGMIAAINKEFPNDFQPFECDSYAMAFTELGDSAFHWAMYGDDFKGVAIGVRLYKLQNFLSEIGLYAPSLIEKHIRVDQVVYSDKNKTSTLDAILTATDVHDLENSLHTLFSLIHASFKREDFSYEKEHRIVFLENYSTKNFQRYMNHHDVGFILEKIVREEDRKKIAAFQTIGLISENKKFTSHGGNIRPYYPLNIARLMETIIPEIVLGCKCSQEHKDLRLFLDYNGMQSTKITSSEKKYR